MTNPTKPPVLRTSRIFPQDPAQMQEVLGKMYSEVAGSVNNRTIGVFPMNAPIPNGETWYMHGAQQKQEGLRQVYTFTATGNIPHGISLPNISSFTRGFGAFTDGTNWYGVIFGSSTSIAGQVSFYITGTNIVVLAGAGAPSITSGSIVLEWLAYV